MGLVKVSRNEAIEIMENNLKILKECADTDTFLVLSYNLEDKKFLGRKRIDAKSGKKLVHDSKTFILNEDFDEDAISTLSIYTAIQRDIYNIIPKGEKHDMIIVHQLE